MASAWDRELDQRYRIVPFVDSELGEQDLIEMWTSEGALPLEVARDRAAEASMVATESASGRPAGVCTTFLDHSERLGMDLWNFRTFVAAAHRQSDIARHLLYRTIDYLGERYESGEDRRAAGMIIVVQNPVLKEHQNRARWRQTGFTYIGDNPAGDHIRVLYFPGAPAPPPPPPRGYG